jgi:zinc protease
MQLIHQQAPGFPITNLYWLFPRTGSCLDPVHHRGLTRLVLRLLTSGAGGLSHAEFNGRMERLGASLGYGLASDHFTLRLTTLTDNLDAALELFLLSFREPNFADEEFARLKEELISSWIADREESKSLRAQEVYLGRSYRDGPQSYLPDGTLEGLGAITAGDVRPHFQDLLGRGEPLLAVLSDLGREEVEARVARRMPEPPLREGLPHPWEAFAPQSNAARRVTVIADRRTQTDEMLLGSFVTHERDPEWHIHRLIAMIFGGDMNSRLFRIVRGEHGYSYGASCWYESAHGRCPRDRVAPFSIYTFPAAEHTAQAVPLVLSLYEDFVAHGPTADELDRAQRALVNSYPFTQDTPNKKLGLALDRALYGITLDDEATHREKLLAVTVDDMRRVLRATHRPELATIVLLGEPARLEPIAQAIPGVERLDVVESP